MKKTITILLMLVMSIAISAQTFGERADAGTRAATLEGDVNKDGVVDIADVTKLIGIILGTDNGDGGGEDEEEVQEQKFDDWTSTNAGNHGTTSSNTYTLNVSDVSVLTFDWEVSSEDNYDWFIVTLDGTEILKKSGTASGSYSHTFTAAGTHTLVAKYTKDGSANSGSDCGKIKNIILRTGDPEKPDTPATTPGTAVDLGLPSGIKWASCNVGATKPEEYGGYYAWGETEEKTNYDWSTYKYCKGSYNTMTKYCTSSYYGTVDNKTTLEPGDDVAHVKWGGKWRMPTKAEQDELRTKCNWKWTTLNGVNGYRVTGPNGNSIFLPAAGYRGGDALINAGSDGGYWSAVLLDGSDGSYACSLYFDSGYWDWIYRRRYFGHSVRPVCQ